MRRDELFPREVISDIPRVTLTGQDMVQVEQHHGLVGYQPEEVVFRVSCGSLNITGQEMQFRLYTSSEAVLVGRITGVSLTGGSKA